MQAWRKSVKELCEPDVCVAESAQSVQMFTNSSRNRLTDEGNGAVLRYFLSLQPERRAKALLCDLRANYEQVLRGNAVPEFLVSFRMLSEKMRQYRWSKESVERMFGVSLKDLRREYFRLTD